MTLPTSLDLYNSEILAGIMFDPRQTISTSHWRTFYPVSCTHLTLPTKA